MNSTTIFNHDAKPPVVSISPVTLEAVDRGTPLQIRISAPLAGERLPVIIFAHGFGNSQDGYAPLANFWAMHGFAVIQPTFLDSLRLNLAEDDPRKPDIWKIRIRDMKCILNQLETIQDMLPAFRNRLDTTRVAVVGHSFGAQTTAMLLGARMNGADHEDVSDARIRVGVLLAAGGHGGNDLSAFAREHLPYLDQRYDTLHTPTLVVAGDNDYSPLTVRGPDWFTDAYFSSPGADALLVLKGGEHMLGGISGYRVSETTDENPDRVAIVQAVTTAYLKSSLYPGDKSWTEALRSLAGTAETTAYIRTKR